MRRVSLDRPVASTSTYQVNNQGPGGRAVHPNHATGTTRSHYGEPYSRRRLINQSILDWLVGRSFGWLAGQSPPAARTICEEPYCCNDKKVPPPLNSMQPFFSSFLLTSHCTHLHTYSTDNILLLSAHLLLPHVRQGPPRRSSRRQSKKRGPPPTCAAANADAKGGGGRLPDGLQRKTKHLSSHHPPEPLV